MTARAVLLWLSIDKPLKCLPCQGDFHLSDKIGPKFRYKKSFRYSYAKRLIIRLLGLVNFFLKLPTLNTLLETTHKILYFSARLCYHFFRSLLYTVHAPGYFKFYKQADTWKVLFW